MGIETIEVISARREKLFQERSRFREAQRERLFAKAEKERLRAKTEKKRAAQKREQEKKLKRAAERLTKIKERARIVSLQEQERLKARDDAKFRSQMERAQRAARRAMQFEDIFTDDVLAAMEEAWRLGCTDREACLVAGLTEEQLHKYQDIHDGYTQYKALLKESPIIEARRTVLEAIKTDPYIAFKFLERKRREEFGQKVELGASDFGKQLANALVERFGGDRSEPVPVGEFKALPEPEGGGSC